MKKVLLVLMISATTIGTNAQTSKNSIGGYGAGISEITWLNGKPALGLGAYGGVLLNHRLLIGAAGYNTFSNETVAGKKENFQFNYYGLYTEYRLIPQKHVNLNIGLTGALGWQENDLVSGIKTRKRDGNNTYVIQPKLAVNIRITRFMQVQAYGSYRFTGNTHSTYFANDNYNGAAAGAALIFGKF